MRRRCARIVSITARSSVQAMIRRPAAGGAALDVDTDDASQALCAPAGTFPERLETPRLILHRPAAGDAEPIFARYETDETSDRFGAAQHGDLFAGEDAVSHLGEACAELALRDRAG